MVGRQDDRSAKCRLTFSRVRRSTPSRRSGADARVARTNEHLAMLQRLPSLLARVTEAKDVARTIVDEARRALGITRGAILLVRDDEQLIVHDQDMFPGGEIPECVRQLAGAAAGDRQPRFLTRRRAAGREDGRPPNAVIPLHLCGRTRTVLLLGELPGEKRAMALSLGEVAALALDRTALLDTERQARRDAERANRFKDAVLAVVSHELRAPLSAIMMWDTTLRSPRATPSMRRRAVTAILESARQQARVIEDLLDATRAGRGEIRLTPGPVDAADVVRTAVDAALPAAQTRGLHLTAHVGPRPTVVNGDRARLLQVLGNLIHNAIKFTPPGGRVDVSLVQLRRGLRITVSDTGCGIEAARLPSIFDAFTSGTPQNGGGLGLGLTIAFELVRLHGGVLEAQSLGIDRGSSFVITLPRARAAARLPDRRSRSASCSSTALAGRSIAVLAPPTGVGRGLTSALRLAGAKVRSCKDGRTLLRALAARRHDALVMDVDAGESPGPLLRQLRTGQASPPFVLGLGERRARSRHHVGFDARLTKPAAAADVIGVLARRLA